MIHEFFQNVAFKMYCARKLEEKSSVTKLDLYLCQKFKSTFLKREAIIKNLPITYMLHILKEFFKNIQYIISKIFPKVFLDTVQHEVNSPF